jgi:UDP-glucose 4-epimerase
VTPDASGLGPRTVEPVTEPSGSGGLAPGAPALVIGGGLVGAHTAVELARLGHPATVYSRSFSPWLVERAASTPGVSLVTGELPAGDGLARLIDAAEVVFLVAGSSTPALSEGDTTASVLGSLIPTLSVLDAMRRTSTRRIVMASSGGTVYGKVQILPTPEIHVRQPISLHGVNAIVGEEYAMFFAREHGLQPTILRFSNVYGPGQYVRGGQGVIAAWCRALIADEPITLIGDGGVRRDFVFARDAAEAVVAAGTAGARGTFNVGSGVATSLSEIADLLGAISGRELVVDRLPPRRVDVPVTMLDVAELTAATGWRATTPLVRGLSLTWEWFQAHGSAPGTGVAGPAAGPADTA